MSAMANRFLLASIITCLLLAVIIAGSVVLRNERRSPTLPTPSVETTSNTAPLSSSQAQVESAALADSPPVPPTPPQEEIVGIGAIMRSDRDTGAILIVGVAPGSPAAAAGLAGNFIIRKIDDLAAEGLGLQDCVQRIRGPAGTIVRLELFDIDANETRTVTLTRQRIKLGQPP
jgi:hypothetical protein